MPDKKQAFAKPVYRHPQTSVCPSDCGGTGHRDLHNVNMSTTRRFAMQSTIPSVAAPASKAESIAPPQTVGRILVCQLRQLGDVLLATPSIELLARAYPDAELHVLTEKKCLPILQNNPHVHTIWPLDPTAHKNIFQEFIWYKTVAASKFDLVVDFQQLPRCRAVVALSRARVRLTFPPPWYLRPLYTHWAKSEPCYAAAHKAGALAPLGITWQGERPRLYLTDAERAGAKEIIAALGLTAGNFITVDPSHRKITRRWPSGHYAKLLDMLADTLPDMKFLFPYGPDEESEARQIRARCRSFKQVVIPDNMLSLRQMAACMEHAAMHIGNCSSPRHIAAAVNLPTFTILGATGFGWQLPSAEHKAVQARMFMDMPCQTCNKNTCPNDLACMQKLTPSLIFSEVMAHLNQFGRFGA